MLAKLRMDSMMKLKAEKAAQEQFEAEEKLKLEKEQKIAQFKPFSFGQTLQQNPDTQTHSFTNEQKECVRDMILDCLQDQVVIANLQSKFIATEDSPADSSDPERDALLQEMGYEVPTKSKKSVVSSKQPNIPKLTAVEAQSLIAKGSELCALSAEKDNALKIAGHLKAANLSIVKDTVPQDFFSAIVPFASDLLAAEDECTRASKLREGVCMYVASNERAFAKVNFRLLIHLEHLYLFPT